MKNLSRGWWMRAIVLRVVGAIAVALTLAAGARAGVELVTSELDEIDITPRGELITVEMTDPAPGSKRDVELVMTVKDAAHLASELRWAVGKAKERAKRAQGVGAGTGMGVGAGVER